MTFQIRGYVEFTFELAVESPGAPTPEYDPIGSLIQALHADPRMMYVTLLPASGGSTPVGAMVDGQLENNFYLRYSGPASSVGHSMMWLDEIVASCFPAPPQD